jgi:sugar phosphate permease
MVTQDLKESRRWRDQIFVFHFIPYKAYYFKILIVE